MAFAAVSLAQFPPSPQPSYGGPPVLNIVNTDDKTAIETDSGLPDMIHEEEYYEWQGFDGWYNNPAHPEWGGAGGFYIDAQRRCLTLDCTANYVY